MPSDADYPNDEQDQSEAFDEDALGDLGHGPGPDMVTFEELPEVLDVTRALGDSDVDEVLEARDADELGDDDLASIGDDLDYDEDAEDDTVLDALEDVPEDAEAYEDEEDDLDVVDGLDDLEEDEAEIEYVENVEETRSNAGRAAQHLESRGELSNEDLEELGYRDGGDKE